MAIEDGYSAPPPRKSRTKWIVGGILLLVAAIAVGVGVGVTQANKNKSSSSSASSKDITTSASILPDGSTTLVTATQTGSASPSASSAAAGGFTKDPNLKKVFWGMAYSPANSIFPDCWANLSSVVADMQIMSQLTSRIRLYGANCNITGLVLAAIKETGVDMEVYPAVYLDSGNLTAQYTAQVEAMEVAFKQFGVSNVAGVAIGNEYILNELTAAGADTAPTGSVFTKSVATLQTYVSQFNTSLLSWNLGKHIPVGTGDAGALMSTTLGEVVDYYMANVHPWFANTTVQDAAAWTYQYYEETDVAPALLATNKPDTFVAETGWPAGWTTPVEGSGQDRDGTDATVANLQYFLDSYVCQANKNGTKYFYFEPFDEPWKDALYGGTEGHWGLFYSNRTLKSITFPDCVLSS